MRTDKTVKEVSFKFFETWDDASFDINHTENKIDVEGAVPPCSVEILREGVRKKYRLKPFLRKTSRGSFIEKIYLRVE